MSGGRFGPQTEHVRALLAAARSLDAAGWARLQQAYRDGHETLEVARARVREVMGWSDGRAPSAGLPHDELLAAFHAGYHVLWSGSSAVAWTAVALAGRHVLPAEVYAALSGPWAGVVGRVHPDDVRSDADCLWPAGVPL